MENKNRVISIIGIFLLVLTVIGGTLAYWTWTTNTTEQTNVVFTVTQDFSCAADGGGNITSDDVSLAPTTCTDTSRAIKRKVTVTPTLNRDDMLLNMDLWLNVNNIGSGLSESENFKFVLSTSSTSCEVGVISSGTFTGTTTGSTVSLLDKKLYTKNNIVPEEYYLYIWLDAAETSSSTMDQTFSLSLGGQCEEVAPLQGEAYALAFDAGMKYDELVEGDIPTYDLVFVRSEEPIEAGDEYDGRIVVKSFSDIETSQYVSIDEYDTCVCDVPWSGFEISGEYGGISSIVFKDTIRPISTAGWFCGVRKVEDIDLSKLDTSQVTDMTCMFNDFTGEWDEVVELDLSTLDTSNVTIMRDMFWQTGVFGSQPLILGMNNWDVSNVTNMQGLFQHSMVGVPNMNGWDTSSVTNMSYMFAGVEINTDIGINNWDVSNVTYMNGVFYVAIINVDIDLSNWNISNVTSYDEFNTDISGTGTLTIPKFGVTQ